MANLSDIAAMGALPIALLTVVRYPRSLPDDDFTALMEGIRDACRQVGTPNVGGDIGSAERIILSASALGIVAPIRNGRSGFAGCVSFDVSHGHDALDEQRIWHILNALSFVVGEDGFENV
jgi:selenophosphate synthase